MCEVTNSKIKYFMYGKKLVHIRVQCYLQYKKQKSKKNKLKKRYVNVYYKWIGMPGHGRHAVIVQGVGEPTATVQFCRSVPVAHLPWVWFSINLQG